MQEEERVPYRPGSRWQVLKAEFSGDDTNPDYRAYRVRFFLDSDMPLKENEMEMCRFYLREGSALRDTYKNFSDMSTEYDTISLIHATVAGVGEKTLHPALLMEFAKELAKTEKKETADFVFEYITGNCHGKMERLSIVKYIMDKGKNDSKEDLSAEDNARLYKELEKILKHKGGRQSSGYSRNLIYVE